MPYKNIEERRECWKRWYYKNRDKVRKQHKIQHQASYYNPIRQVCSIKDCNEIGERHHHSYEKPRDIIWLCKKHHEQLHSRSIRQCEKLSCNNKHLAKGLCKKHYSEFKRNLEKIFK